VLEPHRRFNIYFSKKYGSKLRRSLKFEFDSDSEKYEDGCVVKSLIFECLSSNDNTCGLLKVIEERPLMQIFDEV
jgi:hypothetical protein